MSRLTTKGKGDRGEDAALAYLQRKGYRLVCRNYRFGHKEIDLIMTDGAATVFVEVKARTSDRYGTPGEAVTRQKQRKLLLAAQAYLAAQGQLDAPARFDVAEVELPHGEVRHIVNAFGQ